MALLPPFYLDCVVSIGVKEKEDSISWIGTGFFYGHQTEKNEKGEQLFAVYLVTNKHVIEGHSKVWIKVNPHDGKPGQDFDVDLLDKDGKKIWKEHFDPSVDLAVTRINVGFLQSKNMRFSFFQENDHVSFLDDLKDGALSEGDPVYVLGFPMGQIRSDRLYTICRLGVVARCRDWLEGRSKEILVDAAVFPGNSGGPVIAGIYIAGITGTKARQRADLIGIVQSYIPYQDVAISVQTKRPRIVFEENSGLASVIPTDFLREIIREIHKQLEIPIKA